MDLILYPASANAEFNPSASVNFKKQATKVILSIILFLIVYLALVAAVIVLAFGAGWLGILVILAHPSILTLALGAGLIATGVSLIYFVVKFVSAKTGGGDAGMLLLTREEEPVLFEFLEKLTGETKTSFPHKVYLSSEVNAAVMRKVSFLSIIFPPKKDLVVGVGLINAINISEFKAIMGHEFGHFSQKSLKLGSFNYNMNRIIYNMLYENTGYVNFLNSWARIHSIMSIMAGLTVKISQGIQWILRGMYTLINKNYMALSREMEYNADEIASLVAGSNNLISGLQKSESAERGYRTALTHADRMIESGKKIKNLYHAQLANADTGSSRTSNPRIVYTNQWASHPSNSDREKHLSGLHLEAAANERSAWSLFADPKTRQEQMTNILYAGVKFETDPELISDQQYLEWRNSELQATSLPAVYKGLFDNRLLKISRDQLHELTATATLLSFEQIFSEENLGLQSKLERADADRQAAGAIAQKDIDTKTFDFDGIKYSSGKAADVAEQLEKEIEWLTEKLEDLDKELFRFFYFNSKNPERTMAMYADYLEKQERLVNWAPKISEALRSLDPAEGGNTIESATVYATRLKKFDSEIIGMASREMISGDADFKGKIQKFRSKAHAYFSVKSYVQEDINDLYHLLNDISGELYTQRFNSLRLLLEEQAADAGLAKFL